MWRTHQPDEGVFHAIRPEEIEWKPFAAFPPATRLAVLIGDPNQPGLCDPRSPGRGWPDDAAQASRGSDLHRISGVFYIGLGEEFDENRLMAYDAGSVVVLPGDQPHFHCAKSGEYVTQVTAIGPLGLTYLHSADDPRLQRPRATSS